MTWLGTAGVVATSVVASRDRKRMDLILEKKCTEDPNGFTHREKIEMGVKTYLPTIGTSLATILCILGANALNKRQQAALSASCVALQRMIEEYRDKVQIVVGKDGMEEIDNLVKQEVSDLADGQPPWDEKQTWYIEGQNQFFERTKEEVLTAEYEINRYFRLAGDAKLNDLFELLGLPKNEYGDAYGWDALSGETFYGYQWIDFTHRHFVTNDGISVCEIEMPFAPHPLFEFDEAMERDISEAEARAEAMFHHPIQVP